VGRVLPQENCDRNTEVVLEASPAILQNFCSAGGRAGKSGRREIRGDEKERNGIELKQSRRCGRRGGNTHVGAALYAANPYGPSKREKRRADREREEIRLASVTLSHARRRGKKLL
jgi:hypothetical protein